MGDWVTEPVPALAEFDCFSLPEVLKLCICCEQNKRGPRTVRPRPIHLGITVRDFLSMSLSCLQTSSKEQAFSRHGLK